MTNPAKELTMNSTESVFLTTFTPNPQEKFLKDRLILGQNFSVPPSFYFAEQIQHLGQEEHQGQSLLDALAFYTLSQDLALKASPNLQAFTQWEATDEIWMPKQLRIEFNAICQRKDLIQSEKLLLIRILDIYPWQVHPADLHTLGEYCLKRPSGLRSAESFFLDKIIVEDTKIELTEANWKDFGIAQSIHYLKQIRQNEPAKALEILKEAWTEQKAAARLDLLGCLYIQLSSADLEFLESCQKDRSAKIKELAESLINRLKGDGGLSALLERSQIEKKGLLIKKKILKIEFPLTVKDTFPRQNWLLETFGHLNVSDYWKVLEFDESEWSQLLLKDETLAVLYLIHLFNLETELTPMQQAFLNDCEVSKDHMYYLWSSWLNKWGNIHKNACEYPFFKALTIYFIENISITQYIWEQWLIQNKSPLNKEFSQRLLKVITQKRILIDISKNRPEDLDYALLMGFLIMDQDYHQNLLDLVPNWNSDFSLAPKARRIANIIKLAATFNP